MGAVRALFATLTTTTLFLLGCAGSATTTHKVVVGNACDGHRVIYSVTTLSVDPLRESKLEIDECGNWQRMLDVGYGFTGRLSSAQLASIRRTIERTRFDVDHTGSERACEEGAYVWVSVSDGRQAEFMIEAQCSPWRPDPSLVQLYEGVEQVLELGQLSAQGADHRARTP